MIYVLIVFGLSYDGRELPVSLVTLRDLSSRDLSSHDSVTLLDTRSVGVRERRVLSSSRVF